MLAAIGSLLDLGGKIIDKVIPDKSEAQRLKAALAEQAMAGDLAELQGAVSIITAEASGESWMQRNWRPVTMLTFTGLVVAHWMGYTPPNLPGEQVTALLDIVKIGLGGYVVCRSAEKVAKVWKA